MSVREVIRDGDQVSVGSAPLAALLLLHGATLKGVTPSTSRPDYYDLVLGCNGRREELVRLIRKYLSGREPIPVDDIKEYMGSLTTVRRFLKAAQEQEAHQRHD